MNPNGTSYFFTLNSDYHVTIPMNKLGIWAIAIAGAFLIGAFTANPVVEAAGGWKEALGLHEEDSSAHHDKYTDADAITAVGPHTPTADFNSYWLNDALPSGNENLAVLCNVGDKIIAGSVEIPGGQATIQQNRPIFDQGANSDQEGWQGRLAGIQGPPSISVWAHCLVT